MLAHRVRCSHLEGTAQKPEFSVGFNGFDVSFNASVLVAEVCESHGVCPLLNLIAVSLNP
jgi:hypothetical protein